MTSVEWNEKQCEFQFKIRVFESWELRANWKRVN